MLNPFSSLFIDDKKPSHQESVYVIEGHQLNIVRSKRRKSIAVRNKQNQLVLEAPQSISQHRLFLLLDENRAWLLTQINKLKNLQQMQFSGRPGESFQFLDERFHCLWHSEAPANRRKKFEHAVSFEKSCLQLSFRETLTDEEKQQLTKRAVERFFIEQAQVYFQDKLELYAQQMQLDFHSVQIKGYKSRWGSCYPDGRIQFNWRLMQAPEWVVDYVVVHELAHRVHANHSAKFWALVEQFYPQTQAAKKQLKIHGHQWINFLQN